MAIKDYTGQRFGRLLVVERLPKYKNGYTYYRCKCDCGNEIVTYSAQFVCGKTISCGCYSKEMAKEMPLIKASAIALAIQGTS